MLASNTADTLLLTAEISSIGASEKNKIFLSNVKLNKNFEILDFKKLEIQTFIEGLENNDFVVNKNKKIVISGKFFDAQPLLKSLYKKSKKIFSKNFNSEIKINFDKVKTGTNDDVSDFAMVASINKGSYNKLNMQHLCMFPNHLKKHLHKHRYNCWKIIIYHLTNYLKSQF